MAPPEHHFPVSELEQRVLTVNKNFKEKSRKLPKDFDLKKDCELFELVQYSCTTIEAQLEHRKRNPDGEKLKQECFPFVRLFRRCGSGDKRFHVETTAWEGEHAWKPPKNTANTVSVEEATASQHDAFARYGSYFWSNK
jgi:Mitochondrial export protein Som1